MSAKTFGPTKNRNETFSNRPVTKIWHEVPSAENPYCPKQVSCHGYDLNELMRKATYIEVLFLLFQGELPTRAQAELLEKWWIASINPGPRHPATRASMNAAIGKTNAVHFLPISLAVLGGSHLGAAEVRQSMRFIKENLGKDPTLVMQKLLSEGTRPQSGDWHIAPGFGSRFGGPDLLVDETGNFLHELSGADEALKWGNRFARVLGAERMGWLDPGLAAAVLLDLGFDEYAAMGMFQLARAPGLLAHGLEMVGKPPTAMPFPNDDHYIIEE